MHTACDLSDHVSFSSQLDSLMQDMLSFDLVILNAGIIGELEDIHHTSLEEIERIMQTNVWANKIILDSIIAHHLSPRQIIAISSGASQNGSAGWGGYSLSKATLNMLIKLYAREMEDSHLCALAPGLVLTPMLQNLMENGDESRFPSVRVLKEGDKFTPQEAALKIDSLRERFMDFESGSYIDIRSL